jgi:hypothetical protein
VAEFVDFLVVVLPTVIAVLSVQVSIKLTKGESHKVWWGFTIFLGIGASVLTWFSQATARKQHSAESDAQKQEQTKLRDKLDQSLLSQEHIKGQLDSFAIVLGTIKSTNANSSGDTRQLADLLQKMVKPVPVNSVLDAMTNQQLQDSVLALVKQMRETDSQFERAKREMTDRQWQADLAITDKTQFTAVRDKNWTEIQQTYATQDNEFRQKYLGRAIAARDQMLKRIPPDKIPNVNPMHGPSSLDFGHLLGATTVGRVADYLEQLALALPMK